MIVLVLVQQYKYPTRYTSIYCILYIYNYIYIVSTYLILVSAQVLNF
jgi:hypothetical protein